MRLFTPRARWQIPAAILCSVVCAWARGPEAPAKSRRLPLTLIADVPLPGAATRFDYQDLDSAADRLVIAHMSGAAVVVVKASDGSLLRVLSGISTPRGVTIGGGRIFVTSSPATLVIIDEHSLAEIRRVPTGKGPDGVAYDPDDRVVAVSDQRDGAVSLLADAGVGERTQVRLGDETGNVAYDPARRCFWISVVTRTKPDQLLAVDARSAAISTRIALPGCEGPHGVRLHPNGQSAFVACEDNDLLARVELAGAHAIVTAATGAGPDVMSLDTSLGWLYVAAESGNLTVFDTQQPGLVLIDREHPGDHAHSVIVDSTTHRVFFPLQVGPKGSPALRMMRPQ